MSTSFDSSPHNVAACLGSDGSNDFLFMNDVHPNETQSSENNVADHVAADDTTHNVITGAHKFAPQCDDSVKPCEGKIFQNLVDGINFYKEYARICGFQIRKAGAPA